MANETKPWWEANGAMFGGLLTPEMAQAWTHAWHESKGYTNAEMEAACLGLADIHTGQRPRFPLDLINWIEDKMRANALQIALAGNMPLQRIIKLLPDWEIDLEQAREKVVKLGAPYETSESNAYRELRLSIAKLRNRAFDRQRIESKQREGIQCLIPQMRGV